MALTGTLAVTVHRIEMEMKAAAGATQDKHGVKITIGNDTKATKQVAIQQENVEQTLNFDLKSVNGDAVVLFEINSSNKRGKDPVSSDLVLRDFLASPKNKAISLKSENTTMKVYLTSQWTAKTTTQKYVGDQTANAIETITAAAMGDPQTALAVKGTHRPWFTRVLYYYDTTKYVYAYTTSFRVVSPFARLGESSANLVLQKVSGKNLRDLDQHFLVPVLDTLDNKVDATISTVVTKLFEGQQYVLKKKDDAVSTASSVASKGTSSISAAVGSTVSGVVKVKDYTATQLVNVSSAAYSTAVNVKDYTTTQVVNVSSTTVKKVKGVTVFFVSHIPLLGAKLRT